MTSKTTKISNVWQTLTNPLRKMTSQDIERMLEMAKMGLDSKLQVVYSMIEERTPIFSVCLEKRNSGLASRQWDIVPIDESSEAKTQAERVKKMFVKSDELSEDGLSDAIVHLQNGAFRGRAYVKPFVHDDGTLVWKKLDNWNVLRAYNKNWWSPDYEVGYGLGYDEASWVSSGNLVEIPKDEVCYTLYERAIDLPGTTIYLRDAVGETKWAQFIERCGLPQVVLTAPEGTPDSNLGLWNQRAIQIQNGASGVLPNGSNVNELVSARGQDPFSKFVEHQEELICILSIGGALTTIGGSTGLGSDLADKQNEQFQSLINKDAKKIQNTINAVAIEKVCRFLNQKRMCRFEFVEDDDITPQEYLEMAKTAKELGAAIDLGKLKELTKLQFIVGLEDSSEGKSQSWQPDEYDKEDNEQ